MGRYGQEGTLVYNSIRRDIGIASESTRPYYFVAPGKFAILWEFFFTCFDF